MHLFVCGYPSNVGGANTELWHTVKLWRRLNIDVTLIPTWKADMVWHRRLSEIGCCTRESNPDDLQNVRGLAGGVVVSMCNTRFLAVAERFRELGCRIIWLGCMNWLFPEERRHYRRYGVFDRHVFQSQYQRDTICPQLARFGFETRQGHIIRGAFDIGEFPLRPMAHKPGEPFVVGRLSRAASEKFSPRTWNIYREAAIPIAARVMGWSAAVEARVGPPPRWAECLPAGAETAQAFLAGLHCLAQAGGGAIENWPRVGLEAMSVGVPLVVENKGGWTEMIRHGQTGLLCNSDSDMAEQIARLANNSEYRETIIRQAREAVKTELADFATIGRQWNEILESVAA
jgi:hypothetical protein